MTEDEVREVALREVAQEMLDEALAMLSPSGRRCLTWPETGCTNRVHEGMMLLSPKGFTCFPCAHRLRIVDRDHRLTDRGMEMPVSVRPYLTLVAGRISWLP